MGCRGFCWASIFRWRGFLVIIRLMRSCDTAVNFYLLVSDWVTVSPRHWVGKGRRDAPHTPTAQLNGAQRGAQCPVIIGVCIDDKKWSRKDVTCHVHFSLYLFLWHLGSSCRNFGQTWLPTAKHRVIYALYHYRALSHLVTFPWDFWCYDKC